MTNNASFVLADPERCSGCRACEVACFSAHEKQKPLTVGSIENPCLPKLFLAKSGKIRMPVQCHHCEDAPCISSCLEGALQRTADGNVVLKAERCIGCRNCAIACPFGAIAIVEASLQEAGALSKGGRGQGSVKKCDLCEGRSGGPACIAACPNEALRRVNINSELSDKRACAVESIVI